MFKSVRWRGEQNKIKAEFKLQFHAAQLSPVGVDELTIYVIPADERKPTVNSDKAKVRNGGCRWKNPIYEAMKLVRYPNTGKIDEKIYYFVVSTRSMNDGVIGKVSVDFSDYANTTKPSFIAFPLRNSNWKDILHVEIQNLQGNPILRERFQDKGLKTNLCDSEEDEVSESRWIGKTPPNGGLGDRSGSSGSDITRACSFENLEEENQMEWLLGSDCEENTDGSADEVFCGERFRKLEAVLKVQREKMEDLVKEITSVKEERDDLRADYEKLKAFQSRSNGGKFKVSTAIEDRDLRNFVDEIKQELNHEKETNSNLRLQLKKTQESNSELILAVEDLEKMLEKKNNELKDQDFINRQIKTLEEEIEKQARGFESDIEALTKEKIELEKRAIEAEETLRKMRRENAKTAEKLQEELKKLSMEIALTFESNQKVAKNAIAEADSLRKEVFQLKEEVKKKDEAFRALEKKLEVSNGGTKGNKVALLCSCSKEVEIPKKTTKLLEMPLKWTNKSDEAPEDRHEKESGVEAGKKKEETMERELKEMQERYSELSVKFAEVEGERQELVMALRRNSIKSMKIHRQARSERDPPLNEDPELNE